VTLLDFAARPLVGVLVGGQATRFSGERKGNLPLDDGSTVLSRFIAECERALPGVELVLVGASHGYEGLGLSALADEPSGVGPLGGISALLRFARATGRPQALAFACDMPYVRAALITRLARAAPDALAVAPRDGELWNALAARYSVAALPELEATLARGERAVQRFLARLGSRAVELELLPGELETLADWDRPEDVR
jgi:molybdopterin-guanine dinucleotide biosynthesis protein A